MSLTLTASASEAIASPHVVGRLSAAVGERGRAVLLVPSFAQALEAQLALSRAGLGLGVTVTTPSAWAQERWGVWGDGRNPVDAVGRRLLCARALTAAAAEPGFMVGDTPGGVALLCSLAERGLPWLLEEGRPHEGSTPAEEAMVGVLARYARSLRDQGLVEDGELACALPGALDRAGAEVPPVVAAGFVELSRAQRSLLAGIAAHHDVECVLPACEGPALDCCDTAREALLAACREAGAQVAVAGLVDEGEPRGAESRERGLDGLLGALFRPCDGDGPDVAGCLRVLLPAGPSAQGSLVAEQVAREVGEGCRQIAVVAPDVAGAWRELSARLVAAGVRPSAQLSVLFGSLEPGRAFLEYLECVQALVSLDESWPAATPVRGGERVELGDMSWWPPSGLVDFLLSPLSGMAAARARRLDATWRSNRLLTPGAVLDALQNPSSTSPRVAAATRELLKGRLGSCASRLLNPLLESDEGPGAAARATDGASATPEAAAATPDAAAATPDAAPLDPQARREATAVLSSVLAVAKSLAEAGVTCAKGAPGRVGLPELLGIGRDVLSGSAVSLRLRAELASPRAEALLLSPGSAALLAPCSQDCVVLMGQTSTESKVASPDDALTAIMSAWGVEPAPDAMARARARLLATMRAARRHVVLERLVFGRDGKLAYPCVMMGEVLCAVGLPTDASAESIAARLGEGCVSFRGEASLSLNASLRGEPAGRVAVEEPAPAGVVSPDERALVCPPPEGVSASDQPPLLSASQIESYLECPYKWFSLRRLRLSDCDAGFTGAEMGTFAHRVLEVTHNDLLARRVELALGLDDLVRIRQGEEGTQSDEYRARVAELVAMAQRDPARRLPELAGDPESRLRVAREVLDDEFREHLAHQHQVRGKRRTPAFQALVAHDGEQDGQVARLLADLEDYLGYEAGLLAGYEPRFFEWDFGRPGDCVEYAGVRIQGTIDRVDVDAHGQAVVIDYKHKSPLGFAAEYDLFPKGTSVADVVPGFLPRRVQSLVYAQVVRRAHPELTVRGSIYLCTKGTHELAGAVDEEALDNVLGGMDGRAAKRRREAMGVPRSLDLGGASHGIEGLLDAVEESIAARLERLVAGDIEANPCDEEACNFCPVLNCERRLGR